MSDKKTKFSRLATWRIVELVFVVLLSILVFVLITAIQKTRSQIAVEVLSLDNELENIQQTSSLRLKLVDRADDIGKVKSYLPDQNDLSGVISDIEKTAKEYGVTLRIPEVNEEIDLDENGSPRPEVAGMGRVRLQVVAAGQADDLLEFFHAVELLPYFLYVTEWDLKSSSVQVGRGPAIRGPNQPPGGESEEIEQQADYDLRMDVLLTTLRDE